MQQRKSFKLGRGLFSFYRINFIQYADRLSRLEKSKKEKRKERDQRLKAQAVGKVDSKNHELPVHQAPSAKQDELRSESSATLQGSVSKDPKLPSSVRSLPTLLPDDILNAEPSTSPLIPLSQSDSATEQKISQKKKFLEKRDKHPKDIKIGGGTAIRVFDQGSNDAGSTSKLPPKSSKQSRQVRTNWTMGRRNPASGSSLRRTTGPSSGFVRR